MRKHISAFVAVLLVAAGALFALAVTSAPANATQDTCPHTGDWSKIDGLDSTTYTATAPEGFLIAEVCAKSSTNIAFLTVDPPVGSFTFTTGEGWLSGFVNHKGNPQDLSHVSIRLVPVEEDPTCESDPSPELCEQPPAEPRHDTARGCDLSQYGDFVGGVISRDGTEAYVWSDESDSWVLSGVIEWGPWTQTSVAEDCDPPDPTCETNPSPELCEQPPAEHRSETVVSDPDCEAGVITTTVTNYVTPYVWDEESEAWVLGEEVLDGEPVVTTEPTTAEECPVPEEPEGFENTTSDSECVDGDLVTTETTETGTPVQAEDGTWTIEVTATSSQSVKQDAKQCAPDEPNEPNEPETPNTVVPTSIDAGLSGPTASAQDDTMRAGLFAGAGLLVMLAAGLALCNQRRVGTEK